MNSSSDQFWHDVRGIVFDFDGTLANCPYDFQVMREKLYEIADRWGVPRAELEQHYLLEGIKHGAELLSADPERAEAFRMQAEEMLQHQELRDAQQAYLLPGAVEATRRLHQAGIKIGIITRNCRPVIKQVIGTSGLVYDACLTREDVTRVKPDREHLALALAQIGVKAEQALMVGDHGMDMRVGRELGMRTVGVLTGHASAQELLDAGGEVILAGVKELADRLCDA